MRKGRSPTWLHNPPRLPIPFEDDLAAAPRDGKPQSLRDEIVGAMAVVGGRGGCVRRSCPPSHLRFPRQIRAFVTGPVDKSLVKTPTAANGRVVSAPMEFEIKRPTSGPASRLEWRTAPLWGFRDSGPYLHDGRADTIDQAVAFHGGEAAKIARRYFGLSPRERQQVEVFLKSLTAPEPTAPERVTSAR